MKTKLLIPAVSLIFIFSIYGSAQTAKIESVYTSLDTKNCKTLESSTEEAGWYLGECKGVGGYKLQLTEGDLRQSINVIAPNKKKHQLDLTGNVSTAFSSVGEKAEWRVVRKGKSVTPVALIVRYNASENSDDANKLNSYLVVSKITKGKICVTNVLKSSTNEAARKLADDSALKPCKARRD